MILFNIIGIIVLLGIFFGIAWYVGYKAAKREERVRELSGRDEWRYRTGNID